MPITGSCHCGQSAFRIDGEVPDQLTRCTCSFCAKRGALLAYYTPEQFAMTTPAASDEVYLWHTKTAPHHFCPTCGVSTYTDSPAYEKDGAWDGTTRRIGVNARLFDDFDAEAHTIVVIDGKNLW